MNRIRSIWRTARVLGLAMLITISCHAMAWAQAEAKPKEGKASWVMSYGLVLLCVGVGLLFVLKSANRRDRAEPEKYEQKAELPELEKSKEK